MAWPGIEPASPAELPNRARWIQKLCCTGLSTEIFKLFKFAQFRLLLLYQPPKFNLKRNTALFILPGFKTHNFEFTGQFGIHRMLCSGFINEGDTTYLVYELKMSHLSYKRFYHESLWKLFVNNFVTHYIQARLIFFLLHGICLNPEQSGRRKATVYGFYLDYRLVRASSKVEEKWLKH